METVVILILVGAVLLWLETLLPGMIAGMVGLFCLVAGVVLGYVRGGTQTGNLILLGVIGGLIMGTFCFLYFFPKSRMARIFISQGASGELGVERPELLHQTGTALTHLRPSGSAQINSKRVDVVTEGAMIERGSPIKVIAVEGLRVVVRPL